MKILIRLPNWLGDMIMSMAFLQAITQAYNQAEIHLIAKKELIDLTDLIPGVKAVYPFSKKEYPGIRGIYLFGKKLETEQFDLFFSLPDSLSAAIMGWATGAKKRIGFKKEGRGIFMTNTYYRPLNLHRADEFVSLLEQFQGTKLTGLSTNLEVSYKQPDSNRILINFNSEAQSRRLPLEKAKDLLSKLFESLPGAEFGFIGSPQEVPFVTSILDNFLDKDYKIVNYSGKTDLKSLAYLMASSKVILTTDSGPAHLANSVGCAVVVLNGAGDENNTSPYNKQNLQIIRYGKLPCEPCVKNKCLLFDIPECLNLLNEQLIIQHVKSFLYA